MFSNSCYCKGVVRFFISDWLRIQFGREQAHATETYYGDCYTRVTPDEEYIFAEIGTDIGEDIRFAEFKDK